MPWVPIEYMPARAFGVVLNHERVESLVSLMEQHGAVNVLNAISATRLFEFAQSEGIATDRSNFTKLLSKIPGVIKVGTGSVSYYFDREIVRDLCIAQKERFYPHNTTALAGNGVPRRVGFTEAGAVAKKAVPLLPEDRVELNEDLPIFMKVKKGTSGSFTRFFGSTSSMKHELGALVTRYESKKNEGKAEEANLLLLETLESILGAIRYGVENGRPEDTES